MDTCAAMTQLHKLKPHGDTISHRDTSSPFKGKEHCSTIAKTCILQASGCSARSMHCYHCKETVSFVLHRQDVGLSAVVMYSS